jgi:predicted kinase
MKLILIRGLPGSGKSTLAKIFVDMEYMNYEADMYFIKNNEYVFDKSKIGEAHAWCQKMTLESLQHQSSVVVSNTFTTKKELRPYFEIAKQCGISPTVILCCGSYKSIHNVPQETLDRMNARFEYKIDELFGEFK